MTAVYSKQYIIAELTDPIAEITQCYPTQRSAIMPALYLAQDTYGFLDETAYQAISEILDVPEIWVFELASFYTLYKNKSIGKCHLQICTNVPCMLRGAYDMLEHLQTRLGISQGDTSKDGLFTLSTVECIGSCDVAPAMMVNETYHTKLSKQSIDQLLDQLTQAETESLATDILSLTQNTSSANNEPLANEQPLANKQSSKNTESLTKSAPTAGPES